MSEYQYYEFQAIDKPLSEKDTQALRNLSSRAQITLTSFVNTYNWGDFKGNPLTLMEKYFDAFLYVANWGTHWFMLRIPLKFTNFELIKKYCYGENATVYKKGENLIFEFISETDDHEWEEGENQLSTLILLRSDLIRGDYRCLYLAWLYCAHNGNFEYDEFEPPVPPGLGDLNASLKSFVDFMRIDSVLIAVAAENSASKDRLAEYQKELRLWISNLSKHEKDDILFRLVKDHDPHLGVELMQRFQQTISFEDNAATGKRLRTVGDLITKAETYAAERKRRITEQKAKERAQKERQQAIDREKYLNDLAKREDKVWEKVEGLIQTKRPSDYDEALKLLVDLRDLSKKSNKKMFFEDKVQSIHEKHQRKSTFIRRLKKAGLDVQ
jgi:hypothetical protein